MKDDMLSIPPITDEEKSQFHAGTLFRLDLDVAQHIYSFGDDYKKRLNDFLRKSIKENAF